MPDSRIGMHYQSNINLSVFNFFQWFVFFFIYSEHILIIQMEDITEHVFLCTPVQDIRNKLMNRKDIVSALLEFLFTV